MYDARDIARYLVRIGYSAESPEESVLICPLRLQKLLFYCQGWSLALLKMPLFREPIEAWPKGPVVSDVYKLFRGKSDGIRPDEAGELTTDLSGSAGNLIESVWQYYSRFTPAQLIRKTHEEPAWREARAGLGPDEKSSNPLSHETMATFFGDVAKARTASHPFPMPDPSDVWDADAEFERSGGRGTTLQDAIRRAKLLRPVA